MIASAYLRNARRAESQWNKRPKPSPCTGHSIDILVTANLGDAANYWNRVLGLPEAGVSNQPEGSVAGKHISWGSDKESARSIIILADGVAVGVAAFLSVAVPSVMHELGHVHDDFARGLTFGFPQPPRRCNLSDWPGI